MVESIIKGLKGVAELQGPLQASIWDQGDAVGAWIGDRLVAVVFPTPETLPKVRYTSASASLQYCVLLRHASYHCLQLSACHSSHMCQF